ncbi:MAG: EpsG family protein [Bacteroidales bacterium]|nr:EpsG family protein [Bacteroidales bacterium]
MIYLALIAFVFCCFLYQSLLGKKDNRVFWLCVAMVLFIMTFRSYDPTMVNYQDDIPNYIRFYNNLNSSNYGTPGNTTYGFEPGLSLVCWLLWLFPKSDLFFVLMMRLICMAPILYGIYRYSSQKELSLLLVILLPGCWLLEMITMRQALATSFLLWMVFVYLERPRRWKLWVFVLALMALLSHSTSYLVLIIASVVLFLPFNKKVCLIILAIAAVSGGFFASKLAGLFASFIAPLELLERVTSYISDATEMGEANPASFIVFGILGALCVLSIEKGDRKRELFGKFFVTGIVIYCMLGNYPLVDRMTSFFILTGAIGALPSLPSATMVHKSLLWWSMIAICLVYVYLFYSDNCGETSYFLPYHFFFDRSLLWMYR